MSRSAGDGGLEEEHSEMLLSNVIGSLSVSLEILTSLLGVIFNQFIR